MKLRKILKKVIPAIDKKLSILPQDEIHLLEHRGVIDWIENVCEETIGMEFEELTDVCLVYIQIKYSEKHPLRGFLK